MKLFGLLLFAFMFTACGSSSNEVHYDAPQTTTGGYSVNKVWNIKDFPLTIYVPVEMDQYKDAINAAAQTWEDGIGMPVFNFVFDDITKPNTQWTNSSNSLYDSYKGIFKETSWSFTNLDNGVLAFTGTLSTNGIYQQADILFNFKTYKFGDVVLDPTLQTTVDFQSVITHELGHFIGLDHVSIDDDPNSIMNPTLTKGTAKRKLSTRDIQVVKKLYYLN